MSTAEGLRQRKRKGSGASSAAVAAAGAAENSMHRRNGSSKDDLSLLGDFAAAAPRPVLFVGRDAPGTPPPPSLAGTLRRRLSDPMPEMPHLNVTIVSREERQELVAAGSALLASHWTWEHLQVLLLLGMFSQARSSRRGADAFVRKLPLLVMVYEGIIHSIIDYDYSPSFVFIENSQTYLNLSISQQGCSDVDDLVDETLVNALKITSRKHSATTAYQITQKGRQLLDGLGRYDELKQQMLPLIYYLFDLPVDVVSSIDFSQLGRRHRMKVVWDEKSKRFQILRQLPGLAAEHAAPVVSTIDEPEDVSYVCSPYLPDCLLRDHLASHKMPSFADRACEAALGVTNIRDELEELIYLSEVTLFMGEWIPFGSNQIFALNDKLGSSERLQGGLFLASSDDDPTDTTFSCTAPMTSVNVIDYDVDEFMCGYCKICYPEKEGIIQVENFGMCAQDSGAITFGLKLDAVLNRGSDHVSLDHLARVLLDIRQDSSEIMSNLLSSYQLSLLDCMFLGSAKERSKVNVIVAERVTPMMSPSEFLDKGGYENEIKQVIGDTQMVHMLTEADILFEGMDGLMLVGPHAKQHEDILIAYLQLRSIRTFHQSFYRRVLAVQNTLKEMRSMLDVHERDPQSIQRVRALHSRTEGDVILTQEILTYMMEALGRVELPERPTLLPGGDGSDAGAGAGAAGGGHGGGTSRGVTTGVDATRDPTGAVRLWECLALEKAFETLKRRVREMHKNVSSAQHELHCIVNGIANVETLNQLEISKEVANNTKNVEEVFKSTSRASNSLEMMEVILSGTLAFDIIDRLTGEWSVLDQPWAQAWIGPIMLIPWAWFVINLLLWGVIGFALTRSMRYLSERAERIVVVSMKLNLPISVERLEAFLTSKAVREESVDIKLSGAIRKAHWMQSDDDDSVAFDFTWDQEHQFLLSANITMEKSEEESMTEENVKEAFFADLKAAQIIDMSRLGRDWRSPLRKYVCRN